MSLKDSVNFYNGENLVPGSVTAVEIEDLKYEGFNLDGKTEQYIAYQGDKEFNFHIEREDISTNNKLNNIISIIRCNSGNKISGIVLVLEYISEDNHRLNYKLINMWY